MLWYFKYVMTDCYPCMRLSEKDVLKLDKKVKAKEKGSVELIPVEDAEKEK